MTVISSVLYDCQARVWWARDIKRLQSWVSWENRCYTYIIIIIKRDLISVLSNCKGLIKDTKRTRVRLDRNVAPCSRPITTVIGPLHECKKVCPCTKALSRSGSRA